MVINVTGESIYIHNDFDLHGASFGTARDYVIVNEEFYLVQ